MNHATTRPLVGVRRRCGIDSLSAASNPFGLFVRLGTALCISLSSTGCDPSADSRQQSGLPTIDATEISFLLQDSLLHDIVDIAVSSSGDIWILSSFEPYVHRYSSAGVALLHFGRQGKGPGEITNPWGLLASPENSSSVTVWDIGTRRLATYSADGALIRISSVHVSPGAVRNDIQSIAYGNANHIESVHGGAILADHPYGISHQLDFALTRLLLLDSLGQPRGTAVDFANYSPHTPDGERVARSLAAVPLWTTCHSEQLIVLNPYENAVDWYTPEGKHIRTSNLNIPRRRLTEADLISHVEHLVRQEAQSAEASEVSNLAKGIIAQHRSEFAEFAPTAVDLLCDDGGGIWLNMFSTKDHPIGFSSEWLRLQDGDVASAQVVRFPSGFRPVEIVGHRAFGVYTDHLDVERLAIVRLP